MKNYKLLIIIALVSLIFTSAVVGVVQSVYTIAQMDESVRKVLFPYRFSSYLPESTPVTGLAFSEGVQTKLSIPVSLSGTINGFDIYTTPQGSALRFIGSGLGVNDSILVSSRTHASIGSSNVATVITMGACRRPYTETDFTNAVPIPGYYAKRNQPNNDVGAVALVAPDFWLKNGELLEICINSSNSVTGVSINAFAFSIKEQ